MKSSQESELDFALLLNIKINPDNSKSNTGDYKEVAKYISNMKELWLEPLNQLDQAKNQQKFRSIYLKRGYIEAIDSLHDFIIKETKITLTHIIKNYPEDLKEGIPTTMTIFGGFTNAVSIHLALAKLALGKLESQDQVSQAIEGLRYCSLQFAKLQANTLKLIENLNGVISNQEKAYEFKTKNFFLDNDYKLKPIEEFLELVINKANDPQTEIQSYAYKDDNSTAFIESKNFINTYTKPKGCPIHSAKSDRESLLNKFLDQLTAILTNIVCSEPSIQVK